MRFVGSLAISLLTVFSTAFSTAEAQDRSRPAVVVVARVDSATRSDSAAFAIAVRRGIEADSSFVVVERPPEPGEPMPTRGARFYFEVVASSSSGRTLIELRVYDVESGAMSAREFIRAETGDLAAMLTAVARRVSSTLPTVIPERPPPVPVADSLGLAAAIADWLRGEGPPSRAIEPFIVVGRGNGVHPTAWATLITGAIRERYPALIAAAPTQQTKRIVVSDFAFAGDSVVVGISFERCRTGTTIAHSASTSTYTFRRTANAWEYVKPLRLSVAAGDSLRCPW